MNASLHVLVHGLDRVRLGWLHLLGPFAAPLVRSRELRSALALGTSMLLALVLTAVAPLALLALGPIVLGVPHLAADVRYLVVRPGLHRRPAFWLAVAIPLALLGVTSASSFGWLAIAGAALTLPSRWSARRLSIVLVALGLALVAWALPRAHGLVMAHAHNVLAVLFFLAWPHLVARERTSRLHLVAAGLFALVSAAIFLGALDPLARGVGAIETSDGLGTSLDVHLASLAPDAVPFRLGVRFVLFFAFAQSVHYAVWLRAVPEEDRPRETPRTFRASIAAMRDEGSLPVMIAFGGLALALAVWAALDLQAARWGYLRGALFHGYLELAVAAAALCRSPSRLRTLGA